MDLTAELPDDSPDVLHAAIYRDRNYTEYIGWREVAVAAGEGVSLAASSVPTEGRTAAAIADETADSSFQVWPTGVLALLAVAAMAALMLAAKPAAPIARHR